MSDYYDLDGKPIGPEDWTRLFALRGAVRSQGDNGWTAPETDFSRIGYDEVGKTRVSTVWLGLDHSFGEGPPLIFETMVFDDETFEEHGGWRYTTKEEARAGHERVVAALRAGEEP